jgi:hypothetical protein
MSRAVGICAFARRSLAAISGSRDVELGRAHDALGGGRRVAEDLLLGAARRARKNPAEGEEQPGAADDRGFLEPDVAAQLLQIRLLFRHGAATRPASEPAGDYAGIVDRRCLEPPSTRLLRVHWPALMPQSERVLVRKINKVFTFAITRPAEQI